MESAFARLYRSSKLASCDSSIKQIYTTYAREAPRKEWGLKRAMPSKLATRLATVASLDTREQTTDFASANQQYMLVAAWKENFTESHAPGSAHLGRTAHGLGGSALGSMDEGQTRSSPQRNLSQMTRAEWKRFLDEARSRRAEWKAELEKGNYAPEETLTFMNATNATTNLSDGVHRQPTYHDSASPSEALQVHGRVLNRMGSGYAVAVQGVIANLPLQNHALESGFQYRDVKTFYVHSATFDNQGRPCVTLGISPQGTRESPAAFSMGGRGSFSPHRPRGKDETAMQDKLMSRIEAAMQLASHVSKDGKRRGGSAGDTGPVADALDLLNQTRR
ncbi:hypothetical protein LPJ61_001488 [Coemansia biformis]|uniref:Uncharacterized protein n=1 Tax=Coemansia biformis TaxID=1286918 RepID=A0A9W8D013_9FUNG|nr:hypothetical protein LPJ61_001488 [Coemansia biformis]